MSLVKYGPEIPGSIATGLDDFLQETFGFKLDLWRQYGGWTNDYTSYAIFENGRMLSNACTYRMDLNLCGKAVEAVQIGSVATRRDRRGEGLSRKVIEALL